MGAAGSFSSIMPRSDDRIVFNIFQLSARGVDIAADHQHYRTAQQGVQTSYEADGNRGGRASLLQGWPSNATLLAFISLKMELSWRSSPVGKVRKNLPLLQEENFTQLS